MLVIYKSENQEIIKPAEQIRERKFKLSKAIFILSTATKTSGVRILWSQLQTCKQNQNINTEH